MLVALKSIFTKQQWMKRLRCCRASADLHPALPQSDREHCLFAARALRSSLYIFKESSLNNNVLRYCVWMLRVHQRVRREGWGGQKKKNNNGHVCTFSPCPKCSVLTSLSVFQLVFPPPPPVFTSVRDCPSMVWPTLSYLQEVKKKKNKKKNFSLLVHHRTTIPMF